MREIYTRLKAEGWIDPWLDEEKILPGQDWDMEIEKAVEETDAAIVVISHHSITKEGYLQRELKAVIRKAEEKPDGTIFLIPLRLENCDVPRRLSQWQYVDNFPDEKKSIAFGQVLNSLKIRQNNRPRQQIETSVGEVPIRYRSMVYLIHSVASLRLYKDGVERIPIHVIVDSFNEQILDEIEKVVYHLHPSFPSPERKTDDRERNFPLKTGAWGEFNLSADIYFIGYEKPFTLYRYLNFKSF